MTQSEDLGGNYLKKERAFVKAFLFLVCLTVAHFVHNGWFVSIAELAQHPPVEGTPIYSLFSVTPQPLHAPEAYRVAIPALGRFLLRAFHLEDPSVVAAGLDFIFASSALYLFYRVAVDGLPIAGAKVRDRMLVVGLLLAFFQFPIAWIVPWQRPETLPSALFLAVALFCLVRARRSGVWTVLVLASTGVQAFVRTDVPFVFGIALVVMSFWGETLSEFGSRSANLAKGVCIVLIAGGVQAYLQFIRYPHLHYWPGTKVVQLLGNLQLHNLSNFTIAALPFLLLAVSLMVKRVHLEAVDALVAASSALYLILWFSVGAVDEVRLAVPFMLALSVVAARTSSSFLTNDEVRATV
jgi:hypothetical protein